MDAIELIGVNELPTPTWNYLHTNGISLQVPAENTSPYAAPAEKIWGGTGPDASQWLSRSCTRRESHVIESHTTPDAPLEIVVDGDTGDICDTLITLCAGSHTRIVLVARSTKETNTVCGSRLRLDLAQDAVAHVDVFVALHDGHTFIEDMGADLSDGARLDVAYHLLGAGRTISGLRTENHGARSAVNVDVRYLGRGTQELDLNYILRLTGRKSTADLSAYGVLSDHSKKILRDTIDLVRGAKGAEGNENETVLLAGPGVTNKSLPVVLCDEDDVVGNHGASIGSVSADQMEYMAARGLDEDAVKALLARSVLDSALSAAPTEAARAAVMAVATRVLGEDVSELAELGTTDPDEEAK